MENAGRAVADAVARHPLGTPRSWSLPGPGNNGGDGFVCARVLAERGYPVRVMLLGDDRGRCKGDAAEAARPLARARSRRPTPGALAGAGVIVDALFGAGLDRPVEGRGAGDDRGDECRAARRSSRSICRAASTAPAAR